MTYSTTDANASYQEMLTDRANESAPPHPRAVALENLDSSTPSAFFLFLFLIFYYHMFVVGSDWENSPILEYNWQKSNETKGN